MCDKCQDRAAQIYSANEKALRAEIEELKRTIARLTSAALQEESKSVAKVPSQPAGTIDTTEPPQMAKERKRCSKLSELSRKENFRRVNRLFCDTLSVKLRYEEIIKEALANESQGHPRRLKDIIK